MNLAEIPIKKMSDEEIRAEIEKAGGEQAYRKKVLASYNEPTTPAPAPIQKNAQEVFYDVCEIRAKVLGIPIEKYFKEHPQDWQAIRELGYSRNY